jgi:transcriptional regulator with XRE-family HTH domain
MKRRIGTDLEYRPERCIASKPTSYSVLFCERFINLSTIALYTGISISHLSMLFSGKRQPSLKSAKLIAMALRMSLEAFVRRLEEHTMNVKPYLKRKPIKGPPKKRLPQPEKVLDTVSPGV